MTPVVQEISNHEGTTYRNHENEFLRFAFFFAISLLRVFVNQVLGAFLLAK